MGDAAFGAAHGVPPLGHDLGGPAQRSTAAEFDIDPSLPRSAGYEAAESSVARADDGQDVYSPVAGVATAAGVSPPSTRLQQADGLDTPLSSPRTAIPNPGFSSSATANRAPPPPPLEPSGPPEGASWLQASRSAPYYATYPTPAPSHPRDRSLGTYASGSTYMENGEGPGGAVDASSSAYDAGPNVSQPGSVAGSDQPPPQQQQPPPPQQPPTQGQHPQHVSSPVFAHFPARSQSVPAEYGHGHHLPHPHHPSIPPQHVPMGAYPYAAHPGYVPHVAQAGSASHGGYGAPYEQPDGNPDPSTPSGHPQPRYQYVPYGYNPPMPMGMTQQGVPLFYQTQHAAPHPSMQQPYHHAHPSQQLAMAGGYPLRHEDDHAHHHPHHPSAAAGLVGPAGASVDSAVLGDVGGDESNGNGGSAVSKGSRDGGAQDKKQLKLTKSGKPRLPRQLISCDFCRMRKLRCDGQRPCGHCARRSRECHYQETVRKRGKGKKVKDATGGAGGSGDHRHLVDGHASSSAGGEGEASFSSVGGGLAGPSTDGSLPDGVDHDHYAAPSSAYHHHPHHPQHAAYATDPSHHHHADDPNPGIASLYHHHREPDPNEVAYHHHHHPAAEVAYHAHHHHHPAIHSHHPSQ